MHLLYEELSCKESDLICYRITVLEGTSLIRDITLHYTNNLILRDTYIRLTNTIAYMLNGNSLTIRRIERLIHIMDELRIRIVE